MRPVVLGGQSLGYLLVSTGLLVESDDVRVQSLHGHFEITLVVGQGQLVPVRVVSWTHLGKGHRACPRSQDGEFLQLEPVLVRVLHVLADGPADLLTTSHAAEISQSLLLVRRWVRVVLETCSSLIQSMLLPVEVGRGSVEVAIGDVPA